jgi:hypothetical protein
MSGRQTKNQFLDDLVKGRFAYENEMDGIRDVRGVDFDDVFVLLPAEVLYEKPERRS